MDIHEIRRTNLQWLIDRHYDSRRARLAQALGRQKNEIWRIFATNPTHRRNMGAEFAREIETHMGYEHGWLDVPHSFEHEAEKHVKPQAGRATPKQTVFVNPAGHKQVPILSYRQAADWAVMDTPYPITAGTESLWIHDNGCSRMTVGLRIEGQSLREALYPGDLAFIDREVAPEPGDYVGILLRKTGLFAFGKFMRTKGAKPYEFTIAPENKSYRSLTINRSNPALVVGTAVMVTKLRRRQPSENQDE
jgi:SOS-response transcriptional repressor LexA